MSTEPARVGGPAVSSRFPRLVLAGLTGMVSGGMLHQVAVWTGPEVPAGWRAVASSTQAPTSEGLAPSAGQWSLRHRVMWVSRAALPGRGLRTLSVDVELPPDGLIDIWLNRRGTNQPEAGDLVLRLRESGAPHAQMLVHDDQRLRTVSCVPALELADQASHAVGVEAAEGLLNITLDGQPSVCTAVGGPHPPALQSGWKGVRLSSLTIDGRPVPAPHPGPLVLWIALGGLVSAFVARTERTSGASTAVTVAGDGVVLASVAGTLWLATQGLGSGFGTVVAPVAVAASIRLTLHVARALRPLSQRADWTPTAAVAAAVPGVGLWLLGIPDSVPAALAMGALAIAAAGVGAVIGLVGRPRPWRTLTLVASLITLGAFLARVLAGPSLTVILTGTALGAAAASVAVTVSRLERPAALRFGPVLLSLLAVVCALEFAVGSPVGPVSAAPLAPETPVGPLPVPAAGGVLVSGPLVMGATARGPRVPAGIPGTALAVHPVGDGSWGPREVAAAVQAHRALARPTAFILTAGPSAHREAAKPRPVVFPGLFGGVRTVLPSAQQQDRAELAASIDTIVAGLAPAPVLLVTGTDGPDAAPVRTLQEVFSDAAVHHDHVRHVDFANLVEAHPDQGWIELRGLLTEAAWNRLGTELSEMLEKP